MPTARDSATSPTTRRPTAPPPGGSGRYEHPPDRVAIAYGGEPLPARGLRLRLDVTGRRTPRGRGSPPSNRSVTVRLTERHRHGRSSRAPIVAPAARCFV